MLYGMMAVLGVYIIYKGGVLLWRSQAVQTSLDTGKIQQKIENIAARTWMPGYTAAVEGEDQKSRIGDWFREAAPVYSYLNEMQRAVGTDETSLQEARAENHTENCTAQNRGDQNCTENRADQNRADQNESASFSYENEGDRGERDGSGGKNENSTKEDGADGQEAKDTEENTDKPEHGNEEFDNTDTERNGINAVLNGTDEEFNNTDADRSSTDTGLSAADAGLNSTETEADNIDSESENNIAGSKDAAQEAMGRAVSMEKLAQLADFDYLLNEYFTVDGGTIATEELLNAETFLSEDLRIVKNGEVPQILIYHTHSQEAFADSVEGDPQTTIVGMGEVLAEELRGMGYQVIHDTGEYDLAGGVLDRSAAYDYAGAAVADLLEKYPTIQVVIDLHRDGVEGQKFVTEIDGKKCSMIMFFNGISRNKQDEMLTYLPNPYIKENLAFSFQMQWKAREQYPGFTRNIYLKAERFNLHFRPRSLLIEAGTQLNTVEEERNAMKPLADLLNQVLDPSAGSSEN